MLEAYQSDLLFATIPESTKIADLNLVTSAIQYGGVSFEGNRLPFSLKPNVVSERDALHLANHLGVVRSTLNRLLKRLRRDLSESRDSPLVKFFGTYSKWFGLMASEKRSIDDIMLMRFDAARPRFGQFLAMETNSGCPGGVINCANVKQAWYLSETARSYESHFNIATYPVDRDTGFISFVLELASQLPSPNVAVCNFNGTYTNELSELSERSSRLAKEKGCGRIVTADLREVKVRDGVTYAGDTPVGILYNKIDATMVEPDDPEIGGWLDASASQSSVFLNSLAALYVGEAKSAFAALYDDAVRAHIAVSEQEVRALEESIAYTKRVCDMTCEEYADVQHNRHQYVLKADYESRGVGVYVGATTNKPEWERVLSDYISENGVAQRAIDIETREAEAQSYDCADLAVVEEFSGADAFFFGDTFAGLVGRAHQSSVFNVGNGGREVPTLIVKGQ